MRGIQVVTLVQLAPDAWSEIEARLREFKTDRGVKVEQVFPVLQEHQILGIGALVYAPSQPALDWFGATVTNYAGVKSMRELASCRRS